MMDPRIWRDRIEEEIRSRSAQPGRPDSAEITITVHGRQACGRPAPRTFRFRLDLLLGRSSELHLLRGIVDSIERTYRADVHKHERASQLQAVEARLAAEREAFSSTQGAP